MKVGVVARGDAEQRLEGILATPGVSERIASPPGMPIRRLLPLAPARRSYGHRVLTVGDAAGLTKPTTGGGIFYSLLSGLLAAETLTGALRRDRLAAGDLRAYEARWRARLGPHLWISSWVRRLFARLADEELETLLEALASEDVQRVIRHTARFNWHGELLRTLLGQPGVKSTLFQSLPEVTLSVTPRPRARSPPRRRSRARAGSRRTPPDAAGHPLVAPACPPACVAGALLRAGPG